jgi:NAD(P)-dependent dehydrogenase (short-subunit alcohol dehydrogenase family)
MKWSADRIPDQTGRTAVVTGANTGIGWTTARALAQRGARVLLACRNRERGEAAAARILGERPSGTAEARVLDLADLESVRAFASGVMEHESRLDLLINNAGVMMCPESRTAQGLELQIGVNHFGPFALTMLLLPKLWASPGSRIVTVSSLAARPGRINPQDLHFRDRRYDRSAAYSQSKLANLLFTRELQRRLGSTGTSALAAHPGWTATDLQRHVSLFRFLNPFLAMTPDQGALPTLRAATDPEARGGETYGPEGFLEIRGAPVRVGVPRRAEDAASAEELWQTSEETTGCAVPERTPAGAGARPSAVSNEVDGAGDAL